MKCQCENAGHSPKGCANKANRVVVTNYGRYELCKTCIHDHLFKDMPTQERASAVIYVGHINAKTAKAIKGG